MAGVVRHPSEYTTVPLGSLHVMAVDVGTVITDERTGQKVTIDDNTHCRKGSVIFCTSKTFDALKTAASPAPEKDNG
jgi:hypothetical protein